MRQFDRTIVIEHFSQAFPALAAKSTPDWMVYCVAAEACFDAVVVRDLAQINQDAEMYVLSRLKTLTVVTWAKAIEDPLREWAQLVAYVPQLKSWIPRSRGKVIRLPAPVLTHNSLYSPRERLGRQAKERRVSTAQIGHEAAAQVVDWLIEDGQDPSRFDKLLSQKAGRRKLPPSP